MATNPIKTNSKSFLEIMADLNATAGLADKPEWFKRLVAGIGEVTGIWQDAAANNAYLRTAYTRRAITDICQLIGYDIPEATAASGTIQFYLDSGTTFPFTFAMTDAVAQGGNLGTAFPMRYEARVNTSVSAFSETVTVTAATNIVNVAGTTHVYTLAEGVRMTAATTMPSPLVSGTMYYVIPVAGDATKIKLATSVANAIAGTEIDITTTGTGTLTLALYSVGIECYQQTTNTANPIIGTSDGTTAWQTFQLPDIAILRDTIVITINSVTWTRVTTLATSGATDKHYRVYYDTDGAAWLQFGNGTYGAIPPVFPIYAAYATGGGANSNITAGNLITSYLGSNGDVISCANPGQITGGADPQSIEDARVLAPLLLAASGQFITPEDGEALAEAYAGVEVAKVNKNYYGVLSAQVLIVPTGGGLPSAGLKTAVQTYLIDKTIFSAIDVRVVDPNYVTTNVTGTANMKTGYTFATVEPYITLACRLQFSEVTQEIYTEYITNGIEFAVIKINTFWGTAFGASDYAQIALLLDHVKIPKFGVATYLSDLDALIAGYVAGVNYISFSAPTFPVSPTVQQITTDGVVTITEV